MKMKNCFIMLVAPILASATYANNDKPQVISSAEYEGTFDEQLVEISKHIEGFAGVYFDEKSRLVASIQKTLH